MAMSKSEARRFLTRAREGIRDAEKALAAGDADALNEALNEIGGAAAHIQDTLASYGEGIRGVGDTR